MIYVPLLQVLSEEPGKEVTLNTCTSEALVQVRCNTTCSTPSPYPQPYPSTIHPPARLRRAFVHQQPTTNNQHTRRLWYLTTNADPLTNTATTTSREIPLRIRIRQMESI
eukprot:6598664-Pyramimonas_sp.AAC.2